MADKGICILAVDDNQDNLVTVRAFVSERFQSSFIFTAESGFEALILAKQVNPDVILLDINMPEMDGYEVCRRLKADPNISDIPVIFLTAVKADSENRVRALEVGVEAFLSKPIDISELTAQINAMWKIRKAGVEKKNENRRLAQLVNEKTEQIRKINSELMQTVEILKLENEQRKRSEIELMKAKNKYGSLLNDLPALICEFKLDGVVTYANETYALYYSSKELTNHQENSTSDPAACRIKDSWKQCLNLDIKNPSQTYKECIIRDEKEIWIEWRDRIILDENKRIVSFYSIGIDITETIENEKVITKLLNQHQAMFSEHNAIMLLIDPTNGQIIDSNPSATRFYGYSKQELQSMNVKEICQSQNESLSSDCFNAFAIGNQHITSQHRLKDGTFRMVDIYSSEIAYAGEAVNYAIIFDVNDREEAIGNIRYLSFHDHLTGLYNRRFFEAEMLRLDVSRNLPLTIVMGDVNGLKLINDSFGHVEGDVILKVTADILKRSFRSDDIIARIGGDEYAIILPKTDRNEAQRLINRIKEEIKEVVKENPLLSISFGSATKTSTEFLLKDTMIEAENVMYSHKMYESASMRNKSVNLIMNALFEKSQREMHHSKRVSELCALIAEQMNFDQEGIKRTALAALVHDIGKIGVDEKILNKPARLDEQEWLEMKKHPESGWRILNGTEGFSDVSKIVLHHHERWDGKGYPNQLKGLEIPLESRIIAIADTYDAMTSVRPYNAGVDGSVAVQELQKYAGTQFDPQLVEVFVSKVLKKLT